MCFALVRLAPSSKQEIFRPSGVPGNFYLLPGRLADWAQASLCLVWAAEAFCEAGMEACGTDARRDAIVVGRQLGVVLLEHVQPLGSPLYSIVRPVELVLPLPLPEGARACVGLVAHLEEPGRGIVPAASWHIVIRVRHLDSKPWRTVFRPGRRWVRLRCPLPPLLLIFYFRGAACIRRFLNVPVQSFRPPAAGGLLALPPSRSISDHLGAFLAPLRFPLPAHL